MSISTSRKPDLTEAPEWARWLAQDKDGCWAWFSTKPQPHNFGLYANGTFLASDKGKKEGCSKTTHTLTTPNKDWKKSVIKIAKSKQLKGDK